MNGEEWMKRGIRLLCYLLLFGMGCFFVWNWQMESDLKMKIVYALSMEESTTCQLFFDMGSGYGAQADITVETDENTYDPYQQELYFEIPQQYNLAQGIRLIFNSHEPQRLRSIELYNNGVCVEKLSINQIWDQFEMMPESGVSLEAPYIIMDVREEVVVLEAGPDFMEHFRQAQGNVKKVRWNLTGLFVLILSAVILIDSRCQKEKTTLNKLYRAVWEHGKEFSECVTDKLLPALMGLAVILVFIMAWKSPIYAHPDENVTRMAIDYYMGRWLPTSLDSNWVSGTFSAMGNSRLMEPTYYYFFAGKLGWLVSFFTGSAAYFRMLNVLLFAILCMFVIRKRKSHPWLMLCVAVNPQLWYIASYATSDMWDYFWCFWVIWEIGYEKSLLQVYLNGEKGAWKGLILSGFLFSNIFLGKKNYWVILLFAFLIFALRLCFEKVRPRISVFLRYTGMLLTTGAFSGVAVGIRKLGIWIYEKVDVHEWINPLDPVFQSKEGTLVAMRAQGYTLREVLDRGLFGELWRSFTGDYGWLEYWGSIRYHMIFGLFLLLSVGILIVLLKKCSLQCRLESASAVAIWGIMVLLVVYQCWTGDYEPQGRYLLPCLLVWGFMCAAIGKKPWENPGWAGCLLVLSLLSVFSFIFVGMENLVF